jgi:amino acid transporter
MHTEKETSLISEQGKLNAADQRRLNVWSVAAMGIGSMVGAGIFALLGQAAMVAGRHTYIAFLLGGVVALLSGYSYAKLAIRYPTSGGITDYFNAAFGTGPLSGTLSLMYLLTLMVTIALVAKSFGAYARHLLVGGEASVAWSSIFASGIVILLTLVNAIGSGAVGKAEIILVAIKLSILAILMVSGAAVLDFTQVQEHFHPGWLGIIGSVGLVFFAYAGYGMMANAAGEVAAPEKTIPRAIFLAIGVVIVLYCSLSIIVLAALPPELLLKHPETAVAQAARPVLGQVGFVFVSIAALVATSSAINATVFSAMRVSSALADARQLPGAFNQLVWGRGTTGLFAMVVVILLMMNFIDFASIANIASSTFLACYLGVHIAHWRLLGETKGSPLLVFIGFISMASVLAVFLWNISGQLISLAVIGLVVAGSALVELIMQRQRQPGLS